MGSIIAVFAYLLLVFGIAASKFKDQIDNGAEQKAGVVATGQFAGTNAVLVQY